jgi:hypothetical protein
MKAIFWINNQEFEIIIDKPSKTWLLYNYTLQTIIQKGSIK